MGVTWTGATFSGTDVNVLITPVFQATMEGTSDCTNTGHCTDTTCAGASSYTGWTCNATDTAEPEGTQSLQNDGTSTPTTVQYTDKFDLPELWIKFHLRDDTPSTSNFDYVLEFHQSGGGGNICDAGKTGLRRAGTSAYRAKGCNATAQFDDAAAARDGGYNEWKMHIDQSNGDASIWLPGSDFSGAADYTADGAGTGAVNATTIVFPGSADSNGFDIDDVRIYSSDPDA
jgi:hypothetical protein